MHHKALGNYLRVHRRKAGLSQRELAFLVGYKHEGQVSKHEYSKQVPPLLAALAYEAVFGIPASAIFAGFESSVVRMVEDNIRELEKRLRDRGEKSVHRRRTVHKLEWLANRKQLATSSERTS